MIEPDPLRFIFELDQCSIPYPKIERWDRRQGKRNPQKHKANSLGSSRFLYFQFFNVEPDLKAGEFFMVQVIFVEPFNEFMSIL